ncbi:MULTISPECIES: DMT family transporter [Variovorax]|uniref:DMT family transporter n=1 Tax=Variovorax atrisoli TaxID=3394203 RepID=UPI00104F7F37|nr:MULTISPECIES: DMT family transporter [Variovorax]MBB3643772.1 drug/metabolite transporter (DMT)-like permease [Variovorax sp. BK613]MDR6517355.1 drug/metabolite transporter (DMT)-like permease [Variovorax paradoxus]
MNSAAPASGRLVAYGCLALSMSLVGGYVALSKPLVAAFPVLLLAWLRFGIAALAMPHWLRRSPDEPPMTTRTRWLVFLESFLGNFLFSICMLFGVSLTSAVSAGVIMASIPACVAVASWLFLRERITVRIGLAIACAALGIGLLALSPAASHAPASSADSSASTSMPWLGNLLVFCAVLCETAYAVIGKSLTGRLGPKRIASLINLWGFMLSMPFGIWLALQFDFAAVRFGTWALLVAYALAASIWTVWLWMTGLRNVPAAQAGVFTVLLPVSAALVGVLVLGESLSSPQLVAFVVALIGVVLATWPGRRT